MSTRKTWCYVRITTKLREDIIDLLDELDINALGYQGQLSDSWERLMSKQIQAVKARLNKAKYATRI